jgi:hypothetical protein
MLTIKIKPAGLPLTLPLSMRLYMLLLVIVIDINLAVEAWVSPSPQRNPLPTSRPEVVVSSSSPPPPSDNNLKRIDDPPITSFRSPPHRLTLASPNNQSNRRRWISQVAAAVATASAAQTKQQLPVQPCHAACLPGDVRAQCIGVYKVPIDDNVLPYVQTPEALKKFAPDLKFVEPIKLPPSLQSAFEILESQRLAADDIQSVVSAGRLEEAGIKVLNLIPKITTAGRLVLLSVRQQQSKTTTIDSSSSIDVVNELQYSKIDDLFNTMVGLWSESDIVIGQGLRGEMGVSAVAQIQILDSVKDAIIAMDDFLASAKTILNFS